MFRRAEGKLNLNLQPEFSAEPGDLELELSKDENIGTMEESVLSSDKQVETDLDNDGHLDTLNELRSYEEENILAYADIGAFKNALNKSGDQLKFYKENEDSFQNLFESLLEKIRKLNIDDFIVQSYFEHDLSEKTLENYRNLLLDLEKGLAIVKTLESIANNYDIKDKNILSLVFLFLKEEVSIDFRKVGKIEKKKLHFAVLMYLQEHNLFEGEDLSDKLDIYKNANNIIVEDAGNSVEDESLSGEGENAQKSSVARREILSLYNEAADEEIPSELEKDILEEEVVEEMAAETFVPTVKETTGGGQDEKEDFKPSESEVSEADKETDSKEEEAENNDIEEAREGSVLEKEELGEEEYIPVQAEQIPETKLPADFPDESLSKVDILTSPEEKKRENLEASYAVFLNLYKGELNALEEKIFIAEGRIQEIKAMDIDSERLDTDEKYLEEYGDLCRELVKLCIDIENFEREHRRMKILTDKYEARFNIIHANSRLTLPIQKSEKEWLNEISEGIKDINYISVVIGDKVHDYSIALNSGKLNLSVDPNNSDDILRRQGAKLNEVDRLKSFSPVDRVKLQKWLDLTDVVENTDGLTKQRKLELFYELQKDINAAAFSIDKKYGAVLPSKKAGIPLRFSLEQASISKSYLLAIAERIGDSLPNLNELEKQAFIELLVYQKILSESSLTIEERTYIKNRINIIFRENKKLKKMFSNISNAFKYLKMGNNGYFFVRKEGESDEYTDDDLNEYLVESININPVDAAGKEHRVHNADIAEIEREQKEMEALLKKQEILKEDFIREMRELLSRKTLEKAWSKSRAFDYGVFLQKELFDLLKEKNLVSRDDIVNFLKNYPATIDRNSVNYAWLQHFEFLRDNFLEEENYSDWEK